MSIFGVLKAMHQQKMQRLHDFIHGAPERIDTGLPLDIRIDRVLKVDRTPFILAGEDKLCFTYPGEDHSVIAIGHFSLPGVMFDHFYLTCGAEQSILQIATDIKIGEILQAMYYRELFRIAPSPNNQLGDWPDWIDRDNPEEPASGMLGARELDTPTVLNAPEGNAYEILMPECFGQRTTPLTSIERLTDDPYVARVAKRSHYFCVYGRNVDNDMVEKLFASHVVEDDEEYISILAGIEIDTGAGILGNSGYLQVL